MQKHPSIGEVCGSGVFWAIELVKDRTSREPLAPYAGTSTAMNDMVRSCKEKGLLPFAKFNRIHVVPPCNISAEDATRGLTIPLQ